LALGFVMRVGHPTLGNFVGIVEIFTGNTRYLPHKLKITSKFQWKFKKYQALNQRIVKLISRLHIYCFQELEIAKSDRMPAAARHHPCASCGCQNHLGLIFASVV